MVRYTQITKAKQKIFKEYKQLLLENILTMQKHNIFQINSI